MNPLLFGVKQFHHSIYELGNLIIHGRVQRRVFIYMKEKKLLYLVNSKVACSSIKQSLIDQTLGDDYSVHQYPFVKLSTVPLEQEGLYSFTFVRNPFERLVSCYLSKYHSDLANGKAQMDFNYYLLGLLRKDRGFSYFARMVNLIPDRLADRHFRSQYRLTHDRNGKPLVAWIGRLEHIGESFPELQRRFGLNKLPHYNRTSNYDWRQFYTKEMAEFVYKKYSKDIEVFGYQQEYRELLEYLREGEAEE